MTLASIFLSTVPVLVLATQIALGLLMLGLLITHLLKRECRATTFIAKHRNALSLLVAIVAMSGSLFFSKGLGYTPCELCWYQRICMYPLVPVFAVALWKKWDVRYIVLPLLLIGAGISVYHYNVQFFNAPTFCAIGEVSCAIKGDVAFGYITIPMMALTAFAAMLALQTVGRGKVPAKKRMSSGVNARRKKR